MSNPLQRLRLGLGLIAICLTLGMSHEVDAACIIVRENATATERFAARELQRYIYVRTGEKLSITDKATTKTDDQFVVTLAEHAPREISTEALAPQQYRILSRGLNAGHKQLYIIGGDEVGALYGVYRVAELFGMRFYLNDEVSPTQLAKLEIPVVEEIHRPLFAVRGILPFHDFAEGPDWWNADEYLTIVGQLPKLGMNFIGLHTYPEGDVGPEPSVWIGQAGEYDEHGNVTTAYPASYHTTARGGKYWWTYEPLATSQFAAGAAQLYSRDDFGAEVMKEATFQEQKPNDSIEVFNRTGKMLGVAFAEAKRLGVLTCVGTETPLSLPASVKSRAADSGVKLDTPDAARPFYRAMFERISRAYPVDYYWLWTTEGWTWEGNKPDQFAATENDIKAALGALEEIHSPTILATSGWVLGPQHDRAALDRLLPANSPMSAINPAVGHGAIERQFANLSHRPRWAIPWLENDPDLTAPQLWAGRMRFDAADARRLNCTGLIGIHWRTKILAPNIAALAAAAWDQSWTPADFDGSKIPPQSASGAEGGTIFPKDPVSDAAVLASCRIGMKRYDVLIPGGTYTVKLSFADGEKAHAGERVFSVKLQGKVVAGDLDLASEPNATKVVNLDQIKIGDGHLLIDFESSAGQALISSIEVSGVTNVGSAQYSRKINCGGLAVDGFEADVLDARPRPPETRAMPVAAFYRDFAAANFGEDVAEKIGELFSRIDGKALPAPCNWIDGPGDILPNREPWETEGKAYAFVDEFEGLRSSVKGAANLDRYDYWLNQFRALRFLGKIGCTMGALDEVVEKIQASKDVSKTKELITGQALPLRRSLTSLWTDLLTAELAGASSTGELGTIANLEQRSRLHHHVLDRHDVFLGEKLGHALPADLSVSPSFHGAPRLIVPVVRNSAHDREDVWLRVCLLTKTSANPPTLLWRAVGEDRYQRVVFSPVARSVFEVKLPQLSEAQSLIEYHIEASADGVDLRWPVSDKSENRTLVLF